METAPTHQSGGDGIGAVGSSISREIVGIYSEYFGRGPTRARTFWHDDVVVCVLKDVFTGAEQLLVQGGRFRQAREHRQAFHEELGPVFREVVERNTGHTVETFLAQVSEDGVATELFTLGDLRAP